MGDGERRPDRAGRDHQTREIEKVLEQANLRRKRRDRERDALSAVDRAAGPRQRTEDERHREREQGEDLAAQGADPERQGTDRQREERAQPRRQDHGDVEAHPVAAVEHRRRVGTGAHIRSLPEAEVATEAAQDIPARGLDRPDEHQGEERQIRERETETLAVQREHREHGGHQWKCPQAGGERAPSPPQWPPARANSPCGRARSATTMSENTTNGSVAGEWITEARLDSVPTSKPARSVPTMFPIPPRMTTANTMPNHSNAVNGVNAVDRAKSIPATAAEPPAMPARSMEMRR